MYLIYAWEIPREMSNSRIGGLELRIKYHLQINQRKKGMGRPAIEWPGKSMAEKSKALCRFKSVPSPLVRFSCDLESPFSSCFRDRGILKNGYSCKWEISLQKGNFYSVCRASPLLFRKTILLSKHIFLGGWRVSILVSHSHSLGCHILVSYNIIRWES